MINRKKRLKIKKPDKKNIVGILIVVSALLAAVIITIAIRGRNRENEIADSGGVTRPRLSFSYNGYEINRSNAYNEKMDIALMRDSITPVVNGILIFNLEDTEKIKRLEYNICSSDGEKSFGMGTIDNPKKVENLDVSGIIPEEESVLVVTAHSDDEKWFYYTRLANCAENPPAEAIDFINTFHEKALAKDEGGEIIHAIEPDETGDASTMQYVNIHSGFDQITWGRLSPEVDGGVSWTIKELNDVSASVLLRYYVKCPNKNDNADASQENAESSGTDEKFYVEEFFRVRHIRDGNVTYLLDYERQMEQVFKPGKEVVSGNKILLGIVPSEISYKTYDKGNAVVFTSASDIWSFNSKKNEFVNIFHYKGDFPTAKTHLISCDKNGNVSFAVFGYMNSGKFQGRNGAFVYRYLAEEGVTEEVMSVLSDTSEEITELNLGRLIYYNPDYETLFAMADGVLFKADAKTGKRETIVSGLSKNEYVVSEEGNIIAFSTEGTKSSGETVSPGIVVHNFDTGEETHLESPAEEVYKPLGFLKGDLIYGTIRIADKGKTASGETVWPMYKADIIDSKNVIKKNYQQDGIYILDAEIKENLVTFKQVKREGELFVPVEDDFITNNEKTDEESVTPESYTEGEKRMEWSLLFGHALDQAAPAVKKVKIDETKDVSVEPWEEKAQQDRQTELFYVYGMGKLQSIQEHAGQAIAEADLYNGVVVSNRQHYVWERGNRDLSYGIEGREAEMARLREILKAGKTAVEAMQDISGGKVLDLTGCTAEQLCYIIDQNREVIALPGPDKWMILTGYNEQDMFYIAEDGEEKSISFSELDKMSEEGGRVYISYSE